MTIKNDILWRVFVAFFLLALVGVAVLFQAFRIQVIEGDKWSNLADSLTTRYHTIEAERGNIFSADGRLLATSLPFFEIRMDAIAPTEQLFYGKVDSLALMMSRMFADQSKEHYKQKLISARRQGSRYLLIRRKVTYPELQAIKRWPLFREGRYSGGLLIEQHNKREMPFGVLAHRTIGYVRTGPNAQSVGLEAAYDEHLRGRDGKRLMQKVSGGMWVPLNDENEIAPRNGKDLLTTIDLNIQDVAEDALHRALLEHSAQHGSVIVMEVQTGKIRAIANLGRMPDGSYWEKYNYAIGEATEPGSTFKLASMMALLEDGYVDLDDTVNIGYGEMRFFGQLMRDSEPHNLGKVSVQQSFEISSNVGMSLLANKFYKDKPEKFVAHLRSFRLDQPAGIEIKGEGMPSIKSPGDQGWSRLSIPWMSVGYEITITPLQTLMLYNAIANDGKMVRPYLVEAIQEYGRPIQSFKPEVLDRRIASERTINKMKVMLEGTVERGTGKRIRSSNYSIAGKTGTALIAQGSSGYAKVYQASFAGYFPADDPKYSIIVVVHAPSNGLYYGGSVAAPVFREISDKIFASHLNRELATVNALASAATPRMDARGYTEDFARIAHFQGLDYQTTDELWARAHMDSGVVDLQPLRMAQGQVPNVRGMGLRDALYLLENAGLKVQVEGAGKVHYQSIRAGTAIHPGATIQLKLN